MRTRPMLPWALPCALSLALLWALAWPAVASADTPLSFRHGKGWFLSADVGVGVIGTSSTGSDSFSETGWFFQGRLGGMLSARFALSAEFWSDGHGYADAPGATATQNTLALAATYWVVPRAWLTTGFGSSTGRWYQGGQVQTEAEGIAFMAGAGYEVMARERFAIDATVRVISSGYSIAGLDVQRTGVVFGVGGTWH